MDQVPPALTSGTRHRRTRKNMMEMMSKGNYVIGVREPIGGDRSPRGWQGINEGERKKVSEERTW